MDHAEVGALTLERWEPVLVTWIDSSGKSIWTRVDEEQEALDKRTLVCSTAGFFFHLNGFSVTVALNRDHDMPNVGETIQIPLVAVRSVMRLVPSAAGKEAGRGESVERETGMVYVSLPTAEEVLAATGGHPGKEEARG